MCRHNVGVNRSVCSQSEANMLHFPVQPPGKAHRHAYLYTISLFIKVILAQNMELKEGGGTEVNLISDLFVFCV